MLEHGKRDKHMDRGKKWHARKCAGDAGSMAFPDVRPVSSRGLSDADSQERCLHAHACCGCEVDDWTGRGFNKEQSTGLVISCCFLCCALCPFSFLQCSWPVFSQKY